MSGIPSAVNHQILLVDDDVDGLATFATALRFEGFNVNAATTLAAAVRELELGQFQLVICDLRLPDGDGSELLKRLRCTGSDIPFVFITAFGTVRSAVEAIQGGAHDYLEKPVSIEELVHVVRTYVDPLPNRRGREHPLVIRALALARTRFRDATWTPKRLARNLGVSLEHLSRRFKASGSPGVAAAIRRLRLTEAQRLLETSQLSIKEVAHAAGFRSVKQFERAFRDAEGSTPSHWRRRAAK